jgi:putative ABC transport system ATP-binding protein
MKTIEAKNIVKIYQMGDTKLAALNGASVSIDRGEFVAITGQSGSGKSTLMHLIGCLDKPTEGEFFIDGINTCNANSDELARIRNKKIGFVFQKFHLLSDLTALDNVALPPLYAGKTEQESREMAAKLLEMVELKNRMSHFPYQLSGGQQQRVAIARSLVNNPQIILADEPTGNLDSQTGEVVMGLFKQLNEEKGVTIVIVTHEPYIAAKTNRTIELSDGKIISDSRA